MSDIIHLLPDSVANQIAAGEVIQRPASVVKELVENAVDAGASNIQVIIVDAGRTSIEVIDDGCGMSESDARMSFERHATSKIRQADDLFALHTMGFRGEALPSIAAVAQVRLKTRKADDEIGTELSIAGSKVISQLPVACSVGSHFYVENLFYNVPARRKFLKSNATELNNILTTFERIVLVYPQINFVLHSNGVEVFNLRASSLRQRIINVYGKRLNQDLLPVDVETSVCKITGFIGKPESAKKKGAQQLFFVNGRYMRHPYFHKAVTNAFERLLPGGEQIPYFIYFDVPTGDIDVNIHPTKTEIKFENEQTIWQILSAAIKEALGKFHDIPAIMFDTEVQPDIPVFDPTKRSAPAPHVQYDPQYNPFQQTASPRKEQVPKDWQQLYEGLSSQKTPVMGELFAPEESAETPSLADEKSPIHYQYKGRYVMTAVKSGLMIIDQHRAHVRILFEEYMRHMQEKTATVQKVLFPEWVQLSSTQEKTLEQMMPAMERIGFELTNLGNGSYAVAGVPAGLDGLQPTTLLQQMIAFAQESVMMSDEDIYHTLALSLARHAAIPRGQVLNNQEMEDLVNALFACSNVNYTPDGKKILGILPQAELESLV